MLKSPQGSRVNASEDENGRTPDDFGTHKTPNTNNKNINESKNTNQNSNMSR
jgi:transglutaminase/protease-like cytokinesis protein 3